MMAAKYQHATTDELKRRREAVRYVISNVRRINLFYLEEKADDESWTSYVIRQEKPLRDRRHVGPYRGTSALVLDAFERELGAPERDDTPVPDVPGAVVNADDTRRELAQKEIAKEEYKARQSATSPTFHSATSPEMERLSRVLGRRSFEAQSSPEEAMELVTAPKNEKEETKPIVAQSSADMSVQAASDVIRIVQESNEKVFRGIFEDQVKKEREYRDQMNEMKKQIADLTGLVRSHEDRREKDGRRKLEEEMIRQLRESKPDVRLSTIISKLRAVMGNDSVMVPELERQLARDGDRRESKDESGRFPAKKSKRKSSESWSREVQGKVLSEKRRTLDVPEDGRSTAGSTLTSPSDRQTRSKTGKTKARKPYTPDPSTDEDEGPLFRKRRKNEQSPKSNPRKK